MRAKLGKRILLVILALGVFAAPAAVIAAHQFTDVPDENVFHDDIAWLKDAGVTLGCNPPANDMFCPDNDVTREQMAAFMRRFAQYLGAEDGTVSDADNADTLDGLDSTDFLGAGTIVTSHHGTEWMDNGSTTNAPVYFTREVDLRESAQLGLTAPNEVGGVTYGLSHVELCYDVDGTGEITGTNLQAHLGTEWSTITGDPTDRSSTETECYTVSNSEPLHADSWNVWLTLTGDAGNNHVTMRQVQATWEPTTTNVALLPPTDASDDGTE